MTDDYTPGLEKKAREAQRAQSDDFWRELSPEQVYERAYIAGALEEREKAAQIAESTTTVWRHTNPSREIASRIREQS